MADVFISYSTKVAADAALVRRTLEAQRISCWMAPESIPGGSNYAREIPHAIRSASIFVLILSRAAQASIWVPRELDLAVNEKRVILPFLLEDCPLSDEFNFYLIGAQRCAAYPDRAQALRTLVARCRAYLGASAPPQRKPSTPAAPAQGKSPATPAQEKTSAPAAKPAILPERSYREHDGRLDTLQNPLDAQLLLRALRVPNAEQCYMLCDATGENGIPRGFVCAASGVYLSDGNGSAPTHVPWRALLDCDALFWVDNQLCTQKDKLYRLTHTVSEERLRDKYFAVFSGLRDHVRTRRQGQRSGTPKNS